MSSLHSRNNHTTKNYAKADIKAFWSCPVLFDFFILFQPFSPEFYLIKRIFIKSRSDEILKSYRFQNMKTWILFHLNVAGKLVSCSSTKQNISSTIYGGRGSNLIPVIYTFCWNVFCILKTELYLPCDNAVWSTFKVRHTGVSSWSWNISLKSKLKNWGDGSVFSIVFFTYSCFFP